jgi:ATP-binding cassette, subfamily B, bacterial
MPLFPFFHQHDAMDCGPSCLRMVAAFYGKSFSLQTLREKSYISRQGVSMLGISEAAESIGFRTMGVKISFKQLVEDANLPCIVHWKQKHFVVLFRIQKINKGKDYLLHVADPAIGKIKLSKDEFMKGWASTVQDGEPLGLCLLLEPTPEFHRIEDEIIDKTGFKYLFSYVKPYRKYLFQLFIGLLAGSLIQLLFPFLTQSIVDIGINNQDLSFIQLVLFAQIFLFLSRVSVDFIRSWILLHLSTRINISLISDFLIKLMKLPVSFFDTKLIGDLLQRIGDHQRIENFLTTSTLNILFSMISLVVFGIVLAIYNIWIFLIFFIAAILYVGWVLLFLQRRKELDHRRFNRLADHQSALIQLITGMQEIKLNDCERQKRWEWESIRAKLFRLNILSLSLTQYQQAGASFINELKNIIITFFAAWAVIQGNMTLGMMLAVSYIIGQMNSPIDQLLYFITSTQDAKISLERLGEIHKQKDEDPEEEDKISVLPDEKTITIHNVSFQYEGPHSPFVLKDIQVEIPDGKVTAIVGASGSGKTTLVKLLLSFYRPVAGEIKIGNYRLEKISSKFWRQNCGVVLQDGFLFNDTIANNIALGDEYPDRKKLLEAVKVANIQEFIENLPLGYNSMVGTNGQGLSQGQKQRLLIARAVYKNPLFLFFDEATNALDAGNERIIIENLEKFYKGRTVVVVAHRLSTVKNADQIIVLDKGLIAENGTHAELVKKKGVYYTLVKNQLELGA